MAEEKKTEDGEKKFSDRQTKLVALTALVKQIMFWYASIVVGAIGAYYFFSTMMLM